MKLNELTLTQAAEGLRRREFSSLDLTSVCLSRIKEVDDEINAFITVTEDAALARAAEADKILKDSAKAPALLGLPLGIKDNLMWQGVKTTAGSKMLEHQVATYDATVVDKLKKNGAVFLGKTNMDEFAMGSSGESSFFGPTKNPHDTRRVAGGSSSGSAAAVAAREVLAALGSDTGGSVRQPAAFCGVVGFKPSYGRISRHGLIAMASSLDQVGTLTKTVEDAALLFEALAGPDAFDATVRAEVVPAAVSVRREPGRFRVGVPAEFFIDGMDERVRAAVSFAAEKFAAAGAEMVEVSLPRVAYALATYYILMPAEVSSNLARFDGVRYGYRAPAGNLEELYARTRTEGFGDEVKRRLLLGTYVLSAGYYDAYYKKAQQVRRLIKDEFDAVLSEVDCLLTPTVPGPAFALGEKSADPLTMYLADIFTVPVNIAGLPAISLPAGKVDRLPVGVQLIGGYFEEEKLLRLAYRLEASLAGAV